MRCTSGAAYGLPGNRTTLNEKWSTKNNAFIADYRRRRRTHGTPKTRCAESGSATYCHGAGPRSLALHLHDWTTAASAGFCCRSPCRSIRTLRWAMAGACVEGPPSGISDYITTHPVVHASVKTTTALTTLAMTNALRHRSASCARRSRTAVWRHRERADDGKRLRLPLCARFSAANLVRLLRKHIMRKICSSTPLVDWRIVSSLTTCAVWPQACMRWIENVIDALRDWRTSICSICSPMQYTIQWQTATAQGHPPMHRR